ncbi:G5 domain-containing protein [Microbacterium sp. GXF7504]
MSAQQPGWYPDPIAPTRYRWWDGNAWGDDVAVDGEIRTVPLVPLSGPTASPGPARRIPIWAWIVVGVIALVPILLLSPIIAVAAIVVLITGTIALTTGRRTWLRFRSRKAAGIFTAAAAVLLLLTGPISVGSLGGGTTGQLAANPVGTPTGEPSASTAEPSASPSPKRTATPTPTPVESTREETVVEEIAFTESWVDDGGLPSGQTQVRTYGQNGEKTLTYTVHLVDGQEVGRELTSEVVTREPVTQVVANGTYVAPAPAPAPAQPASGCDPNYAGACVPIDSDVDCAGGSGDGPSYFSGVAQVVGRDVYGLDRDKDGWACETD